MSGCAKWSFDIIMIIMMIIIMIRIRYLGKTTFFKRNFGGGGGGSKYILKNIFSFHDSADFPIYFHCLVSTLLSEACARHISPEQHQLQTPVTHRCLSHSLTTSRLTPILTSPSHFSVQNRVDPACLHGELSITETLHIIINKHISKSN